MSAVVDLSGKRFGSLIVVGRANSLNGRAAWGCECQCGSVLVVAGQHLRRKVVTSCGCVKADRAKEMGVQNKTHGKTKTPEFRIWTGMISRCCNKNDYRFKRHGGRGIKVCDRWMKFENFYEGMGSVPFQGAELDRIDNDKCYEPENCRWVTSKQNNNNRSSCCYIEHGGAVQTVTQWVEQIGINPATLRVRLEAGWPVEKALTQPVRGYKHV